MIWYLTLVTKFQLYIVLWVPQVNTLNRVGDESIETLNLLGASDIYKWSYNVILEVFKNYSRDATIKCRGTRGFVIILKMILMYLTNKNNITWKLFKEIFKRRNLNKRENEIILTENNHCIYNTRSERISLSIFEW